MMSEKKAIVILGTTGMIGSTVAKYLTSHDIKVTEVNRTHEVAVANNEVIKFDAQRADIRTLYEQIPRNSLILNLYGLIRHKINEQSASSIREAEEINSILPRQMEKYSHQYEHRIIQIGTDCVFSGRKGQYNEKSNKDPLDIYGISKKNGEVNSSQLMLLRVSVIGKEVKSHNELLDWVIKSERSATLPGFTNHYWNGITALHLAKILNAIIVNDLFQTVNRHLVPADSCSKYELLKLIRHYGNRKDLFIEPTEALSAVDRRLSTMFPDFNSMIWAAAGHNNLPTICEMVEEYFEVSRG